ncbi:TPA: hypothetical protein ACNV1G_004558 [Citrobacter amalonaticus]
MKYFKYIHEAATEAMDNLYVARQALFDEGVAFCQRFGGRPVFGESITDVSFRGIKFNDPLPEVPEIWTKPEHDSGACWPRKRVPSSLRQASNDLHHEWDAHRPRSRVNSEALYTALGLNWGMLILTGATYFRYQGVVYLATSSTPEASAGAVEILGSEYEAAYRAHKGHKTSADAAM